MQKNADESMRLVSKELTLGNKKFSPADIENNLILSSAFFCIPGILNGFEKLRQIDCNYANCMQDMQNGQTKDACDKARAYSKCKYVYGSVAGVVLQMFASGAQEFVQALTKWLEDPIGSALNAFTKKCDTTCKNEGAKCGGCLLPSIVTAIKDFQTLKNLMNFKEDFKLQDQC